MEKREIIMYWLQSADQDYDTMKFLFKNNRFVHALFFGHLILEKLRKAIWINQNNQNYPPKIHNILSILKQTDVQLMEEQKIFILKLNLYNIEGRYPDDIARIYKITNEKLAKTYYKNINNLTVCLSEKLH